MKNELKEIQTNLSPDDLQSFKDQCEDEDVLKGVDEEKSKRSREAFLTITVDLLRRMKQNKFAEHLLRSENYSLNIKHSTMTQEIDINTFKICARDESWTFCVFVCVSLRNLHWELEVVSA